jgi:glutamyl-tRNA reductase
VAHREPFHLVGERLEQTGAMLMQLWGVHEFAVLNTCNRVELHAVIGEAPGLETAILRILGFDRLDDDDYYVHRGMQAFEHSSVTVAGLLSQTPGEKHIVAQFKEMLSYAMEQGWAGSMLQQWQSSVLHVSKDIRAETASLLQDWEIEDLCLQYIGAYSPDIAQAKTAVIGAGVVGRGLVDRLAAKGCEVDWFYHHNQPDVPATCTDRVRLFDMNDLRDRLGLARIVVCATSGQGHVLHMGHAPFFNLEEHTLIVDLAMPRNVDSQLDGIADSIRVVDLDDLKHWYRRQVADLGRILEISTHIVDGHRDMYDRLLDSFQGGNPGQ